MEMGREGHSGLYTMHFCNLFPPAAVEGDAAKAKAGKDDGPAAPAAPAMTSSSHTPPCSISQFSQWHVLIRMNVENDVCFVKGDAKVFSPTPSLASPMARGIKANGEPAVYVTEPDGIPIVPIPQKDRRCQVLIEGAYRTPEDAHHHNHTSITNHRGTDHHHSNHEREGAVSFRLEVHFDRLEAELLGVREPAMLEDVTLSCGGYKGCGWHIGTAVVKAGGRPVVTPKPLRFLLKTFLGKRCTSCLDPVYAIGYTCDECEATQYCSRECLQAHMRRGHGLLCPLLKSRYRTRAGYVATEVSDDTGLIAWWRCLENGEYSILVDSHNALGYGVEYTVNSLKSPKEDGLQYRLIHPKGSLSGSGGDGASTAAAATSSGSGSGADAGKPSSSPPPPPPPVPSDEAVVDFTCVLMREVNRSAILEGCVPLSSVCLSYLYYFSPSTEITIQSHTLFFTTFNLDEIEGPVTTIEEYVAYARPLHALATLQIEYALKSPLPSEFWRRIKLAKDVARALVSLNASKPCASLADMAAVVAREHTQSLALLSKIYVIMATRSPEDHAIRWLENAEHSLRQGSAPRMVAAVAGATTTQDQHVIAMDYFQLSALLLLYRDEEKDREAARLRTEGSKLMRHLRKKQLRLRDVVTPSAPSLSSPSPSSAAAAAAASAAASVGSAPPAQQQSGVEKMEEAAAAAAAAVSSAT